LEKLYKLKEITEAEFKDGLSKLGYSEADIEHIKKSIKTEPTETERDLSKSDILRLFKEGIIVEDKARELLEKLGYDKSEIDLLIDYAIHMKELSRLARKEKERDLTKTEILRLFRERKIKRDDAKLRLKELGYSDEDIELLLELYEPVEKAQREANERDLTTSQVLTAFRYRIITKEEADAKLEELGYDKEERDLLIRIEEVRMQSQVKERVRDLSKTDILRLLREGIIDPNEAKQMLIDIGYDETEAELLIILELMKLVEHGEATSATA